MYTLDKYICVSRASKALRELAKRNTKIKEIKIRSLASSGITDSLSGDIIDLADEILLSEERYLNIEDQRKIIKLFETLLNGAKLTKFISVSKTYSTNKDLDLANIPLFLLETVNKSKIVLFITVNQVIIISPFQNKNCIDSSGCYYIESLFSMRSLDEIGGIDGLLNHDEALSNLKSTIENYLSGIQSANNLITELFCSTPLTSSDIVPSESNIMNQINSKYEIEASSFDGVLDTSDFMPLYISSNQQFVYIDDMTNRNTGKRISYIASYDGPNKPKYDKYNDKLIASNVVIKDGDAYSRFTIELSDYMYYIGENKIAVMVNDDSDKKFDTIKIKETFSLPVRHNGSESIQDVGIMLKKYGLRATNGMSQILAPLLSFPSDMVKEIFRDIKKFFFLFDKEIEKQDADKYQEKALSDNLDAFSDKISHWIRIGIFSGLTSALLGGHIIVAILAALFWRLDDANMRVRAINRVIKNFRDKINRIETAIEISKQESRYEEVIELMKQKQIHESAIRELVILKKTNYEAADQAYKEKYPDLVIDENISKSGSVY